MNLLTPFLRAIKVWVGNTLIGERKGLHFQAGSNVMITGTDDPTNERVTLTISASGGSGGGELEAILAGVPTAIVQGLVQDDQIVVPYALCATTATTFTTATDTIYWIPWVVPRGISIVRVALNVTTSATGSSATIGLYSSSALSLYAPYARLETTSALNTDTTGLKTANVFWSLSAGVYWFALLITGGSPTLRAIAPSACRALALPSLGTASTTMWRSSGTSLPSYAPTSNYTSVSSEVPAIGVNYSMAI